MKIDTANITAASAVISLDRIYQAAHTLKNVIRKTDLIPAPRIPVDCELYLKAENLQVTGSFKVRGAYFKMSSLTDEEREKGVVACSAGNHAQGVALAAQKSGTSAVIFLPSSAPISKVEETRRYGAEIRLIDGVYDDAYTAALEYQKSTGAVFIHPFDDPDVICGQGTIGLEILEQLPDAEAVIVPIGGGGLIAGVAFAIKKLNPKCKVYGVQAAGAASMEISYNTKKKTALETVSTFADGIAVKCPGDETFSAVTEFVDGICTVTDDETAAAILMLMERQKMVAEGAGAVAVAAALYNKFPFEGKKVCALLSGGNIDVNILSRVITRGLLMSGRLTDLTVQLIDKPGQLRDVSAIISNLGANVIRVNHNYGGENTDINGCYLKLSLETKNFEHIQEIRHELTSNGYKIV